jgi:ribonuclease P protein component
VLAADQRLTEPELFRSASRQGRRAGSRTLVVHLLLPDEQQVVGMSGGGRDQHERPARVGFVVSKAVGGAVVRNRVKRRLRHLMRERMLAFPPEAVLVVRAQPAAAQASYPTLARELDRCLERVRAAGPEAPR